MYCHRNFINGGSTTIFISLFVFCFLVLFSKFVRSQWLIDISSIELFCILYYLTGCTLRLLTCHLTGWLWNYNNCFILALIRAMFFIQYLLYNPSRFTCRHSIHSISCQCQCVLSRNYYDVMECVEWWRMKWNVLLHTQILCGYYLHQCVYILLWVMSHGVIDFGLIVLIY